MDIPNVISLENQKFIKDNFSIALEAYELFIYENDLFNLPNDIQDWSLLGSLRTYAINKMFYNSILENESAVNIEFEKINNFGKKALFLHMDDYLLTISRIPERIFTNEGSNFYLDSNAKYKKNLAKRNLDIIPKQLNLFDAEIKNFNKSDEKYAQILYRYTNKNLSILKIVVPDPTLEYSLKQFDILKNVKDTSLEEINKDIENEQIIFLKKDLEKFYKKSEINGIE